MNYPYGQHLAMAMPAVAWGERSEGISAPGVPLEEMVKLSGTAVIQDGYLVPSDAPGFGLEIDLAALDRVVARDCWIALRIERRVVTRCSRARAPRSLSVRREP